MTLILNAWALDFALRHLEEGDGGEDRKTDSEFIPEDYWDKMGKLFKAMSHEATKFSMAFSSEPCPKGEALVSLVSSMEKSVLAFVSVFYGLPKSQGLHLWRSTQRAVIQVLEDLCSLVKVVIEFGAGTQDQLKSTGMVWEDADLFPSLPKDNKEAISAQAKSNLSLVADALTEIEEAADSDSPMDEMLLGLDGISEENDDTWSEDDKTLLAPCLGLIKVTKTLIKKTEHAARKNGQCVTQGQIQELDDVGEVISRLSPSVDDFILSLYPPLDRSNMQEHANQLFTLHGKLLDLLRKSHFTTEDDEKWVNFLFKANNHNWEKIQKEAVNVT
ncbi:hypothetical protein FSP39_003292 [Pinctada imbricata]|uniref:Cyclin-D1-binding protein 1-like protein n=1 Tax=Pinctada imbricata TaxID=66713 RepID=A0AA89BNC7_PINIB|nr:hypothetical protein FSP39_003292 [Pinctada imbricata]